MTTSTTPPTSPSAMPSGQPARASSGQPAGASSGALAETPSGSTTRTPSGAMAGTPAKTTPTPVLTELIIDNLGLIEHAQLNLGPGLTVLSGETGAGKTLVVTGLQLLSGARADKGMVRHGASHATVQAVFSPPPANDWTQDDDTELLITREIGAQATARNRVRIQGQLATGASLQELTNQLIELHGQHETAQLALADVQRTMLNLWDTDTISPLLSAYSEAYTTWRNHRIALRDAKVHATTNARQAQQLTHECEQIEQANVILDEEIALEQSILTLQHVKEVEETAQGVRTLLIEDTNGGMDASSALNQVMESIGLVDHGARAGIHPAFSELATRLRGVEGELVDIGNELEHIISHLDADPASFDEAMERMSVLKGLFRMYGPTTKDVLAYYEEAKETLELIGGGAERIAHLQQLVADGHEEVMRTGSALRAAREHAGEQLAEAVNGHLGDLAMPNARMTVRITPLDKPQPHGLDLVEFWVQTNKGSQPGLLTKIASGGERSRIALAIKVALANVHETPVLIFDEVDAGVGGQAATAIGNKLAILAAHCQVMCVTHVAQIAAYADHHFMVDKQDIDDATITSVTEIAPDQRTSELARMLSGTDSDVAMAHATELYETATADKEHARAKSTKPSAKTAASTPGSGQPASASSNTSATSKPSAKTAASIPGTSQPATSDPSSDQVSA